MNLKDDILNLVLKLFNLTVGIVTYVDLDNGTCSVKIDDVNLVECDISFLTARSHSKTKTVWGDLTHISAGDFVLLMARSGKFYIVQHLIGFKNFKEIYSDGKVKINRIKDPDDTDSTLDEKLKIGEKLLRSLGLGDIFFDKFGNILMDTHKEIVLRIGDRDANHKISSPETTLRIGRIKDENGDRKEDEGKKLVLELNYNDNGKLTLNEDGDWKVETDGDIKIDAGGTIEIGSGVVKQDCNNLMNCLFTGAPHSTAPNVKV